MHDLTQCKEALSKIRTEKLFLGFEFCLHSKCTLLQITPQTKICSCHLARKLWQSKGIDIMLKKKACILPNWMW